MDYILKWNHSKSEQVPYLGPHCISMFSFTDAYPTLQSSENLFVDFLSTISVESTGLEALDQVAELEDLVTAHVHALKGQKSSNPVVKDVRKYIKSWYKL